MAEIKISDLSIGDWVATPSAEGYIIDLYTSKKAGCIARLVHDDVQMVSEWECIHLEPIPLTPEILEKNGLEYEDDENDAVIFLCCDMFWARLCVGDTFWQVGIHNEDRLDAVVCDVKHTHQLQHALRLAGVEKEIEV